MGVEMLWFQASSVINSEGRDSGQGGEVLMEPSLCPVCAAALSSNTFLLSSSCCAQRWFLLFLPGGRVGRIFYPYNPPWPSFCHLVPCLRPRYLFALTPVQSKLHAGPYRCSAYPQFICKLRLYPLALLIAAMVFITVPLLWLWAQFICWLYDSYVQVTHCFGGR